MSYKRNYKHFEIVPGITAQCYSEGTRYGFRHVCSLMKNSQEIASSKASYYNRTWERYEFQSVIKAAIEQDAGWQMTMPEYRACQKWVEEDHTDWGPFKALSAICAMGELMAKDKTDANKFKKRMLSTVPGIDFPDDFDSLPEEEKQKRLDGAIGQIG